MISSIPLTDRELLSAFVKSADGTAFAALTERHLGLVFGVACRRTGSREMAQEAAQNTFCRLARHAPKLNVGTSLGPWLHAVALREAGTLLRAEAARQRAMQILAVSAGPPETGGFSAPPPPGSEHLDEALAALPDAARRVLVLRYLQGMSLREVAIEENTSEEAARKRVTRALEHLTRLLARRGVTSASVTACLATASLLWPAPTSAATLAARALKQAAAPAAGAGLSGMAGFALSQWPVAAVFLLSAIPAAWPWGAGDSTPRIPVSDARSSSHPSKPGEHPMETATLKIDLKTEMERRERARTWRQEVVSRLGDGTRMTSLDMNTANGERLAELRQSIAGFDLVRIRAAVEDLREESGFSLIAPALFARWAESAPDEAWSAALQQNNQDVIQSVVAALGDRDPKAALARINGAPIELRGWTHTWANALAARTARANPELAVKLTESALDTERGHLMLQAALGEVLSDTPRFVLETLHQREEAGAPMSWITEFFEERLSAGLTTASVETLLSSAEDLPDDSTVKRVARYAAGQLIAKDDPARAADLVSRPMGPHFLSARMGGLIYVTKIWMAQDAPMASAWLKNLREEDSQTVDRVLDALGLRLADNKTSLPALEK